MANPKIEAIREMVGRGFTYREVGIEFEVSHQYVAQVVTPHAVKTALRRHAEGYRKRNANARMYQCGKCDEFGHNARTCTKEIENAR